jgi:hypothetical protein
MSSEPEVPQAVPGESIQEAPDLEYDLAHEAAGEAARAGREPTTGEPVYVVTQTEGFDGDYGYDLAHDVPGR